jgi:hypothetical protein
MEVSMFASKFDLPDHFGSRVTAIHEHVRDTQASQSSSSRKEALAKALIESCELLRDISVGAVAYELEEILLGNVSLNDIPLQGLAMERFLEDERTILREVGVGESAIRDIDTLCRQIQHLREFKLSPENVVEKFSQLQQLVCGQSEEAITRTRRRVRAADVWMGVAGVTVIITNAGAMTLGAPQAALSASMGGAMIGRALK